MTTPATVALVVFPQCDLMDVGGPFEVFLTASRLEVRAGRPAPFDVVTVGAGAGEGPVPAYGPLSVVASAAGPDSAPATLDVVVVPGAIAIDEVLADAAVMADVGALADRAGLVASVCTGSFLLAGIGLLGGRPFTTHWEDLDALAAHPAVAGTGAEPRRARWVDDGDLVTGGGLTNGIAMALHLVDRLASRELAVATARQLDYAWDPDAAEG